MKNLTKLLPKIGIAFVVLTAVGVNLTMAYIMFAPDTMPKPFYLNSSNAAAAQPAEGEPAEGSEAGGHEAAPASGHGGSETGGLSAPVEIRPGEGLMVDTGTKIVNLVDPTGRKYLRIGMVLEFAPTDLSYYTLAGEEKALFLEEFNAEVSQKLPVINNVIITVLSSKTFDDVYTADGKEKLRKDVQSILNEQLPEYRVIFVYFTEFVIQ